MGEGDSIWSRKGATLSDKSARQEFGLTQQEIVAAICERNKWADEALAHKGLNIAWPKLRTLVIGERSKASAKQSEMF